MGQVDIARAVDLAALSARVDGSIPASQKGAPSGVASLDAGGLIPSAQLPPLAITNTFPVANQAAMLALTAQVGDVAIRADGTGSWILRAEPASVLANWSQLSAPTDAVSSVDGRTGAVDLSDRYVQPSALTSFTRDRGTGTVLPTTDLRRGDVYFHTGLAALMVYTGAAWRQAVRAEVADLAARTAISTGYAADLHNGFEVLDLATGITWTWFGATTGGWVALGAWTILESSTSFTWAVPIGGNPGTTMPAIAGGTDASFSVTVPKGRTMEVEWTTPLCNITASGTLVLRLAIGSAVLDGVVMTAPSAGGPFLPGRVRGSYKGTGAAVTVLPQGWSITAACSLNANAAVPQGIRLSYRIV